MNIYQKNNIPDHLLEYFEPAELGLEKTPDEYVKNMVEMFRLVRDLLTDDGTLWLNLGDSYAGSWGNQGRKETRGSQRPINVEMIQPVSDNRYPDKISNTGKIPEGSGLKPKDLIGIPWRVALALQSDGWYLRQDIIWEKPNCMPRPDKDRCVTSHEYIFLLSKSKNYYFDYQAIQEDATNSGVVVKLGVKSFSKGQAAGRCVKPSGNGTQDSYTVPEKRNKRSVWRVTTKPYKGAHFATFPADLILPCVLAGSRPNDIVLDPFMGSGTTAQVALQNGRRYLGCELNPEYKVLIDKRLEAVEF